MNKMKGNQLIKNTISLKTNQNVITNEIINYIAEYPKMHNQKLKGKKYDKVSLNHSNLQIIKKINRSRNQCFSPNYSIDY